MTRKGMKKIWAWKPSAIEGEKLIEFAEWLNSWADFNKYKESLDCKHIIGKVDRPNHITDFGRGYNQAISDVWDKLGMRYSGKFVNAKKSEVKK